MFTFDKIRRNAKPVLMQEMLDILKEHPGPEYLATLSRLFTDLTGFETTGCGFLPVGGDHFLGNYYFRFGVMPPYADTAREIFNKRSAGHPIDELLPVKVLVAVKGELPVSLPTVFSGPQTPAPVQNVRMH